MTILGSLVSFGNAPVQRQSVSLSSVNNIIKNPHASNGQTSNGLSFTCTSPCYIDYNKVFAHGIGMGVLESDCVCP